MSPFRLIARPRSLSYHVEGILPGAGYGGRCSARTAQRLGCLTESQVFCANDLRKASGQGEAGRRASSKVNTETQKVSALPSRRWDSGELYEPYVGRWSRAVARGFLGWLGRPSGGDWLDVGCGTGALTETILGLCEPRAVTGVDPSEGFIDFAKAHIRDMRVQFKVADAQTMPFDASSFDAVVSGLVVNFIPDPMEAAAEMRRVARPGGKVAAYVWDYAGKMELIRYFWDAAVELNPKAAGLDEGRRFQICKPGGLETVFSAAGLKEIETSAIEVPTVFRDFDDYWSPFLGGQGPAPGYNMSLNEDERAALRELLRRRLPIRPDGSIQLVARAWAVKGRA